MKKGSLVKIIGRPNIIWSIIKISGREVSLKKEYYKCWISSEWDKAVQEYLEESNLSNLIEAEKPY